MENNWENIKLGTHRGLIDGTIENHECDPQEDCPKCHGSGQCQKCHGSGEVDCHVCHGSGRCKKCNGQGHTRCTECGGTGRCRKCGGTGTVVCTRCHGTGYYDGGTCKICNGKGRVLCRHCAASGGQKVVRSIFGKENFEGSGRCPKCDGTGELECKTCHGTGDCPSCKGTGKETCQTCHGTGNCTNCMGSGKVTCRRCEGSGWYQTFSIYNTNYYARKWEYISIEALREGLKMATSTPVFNGLYRKWKTKDNLEFDKSDNLIQKVNQDFCTTDAYKSFDKAYNTALKAAGAADTPYRQAVNIVKVPVTEIKFSINGKEYTVQVMGNNGVVMCDELPKKVELYKPSFIQRIKLLFTKKKRHLSYIKLAAYIFQCDGKGVEESHVLDIFISSLKLKPEKEKILREQLKSFNRDMPYELLRKEISSLFSSKKTLTFAWQCMAVEKNISSQEQELFNKLVAEYKLEPSEIDSLKNFASKYSILKDEYLVNEYLGS